MASSNTDFLRYSAYSIKELITRKLSQNSKFTDQVYEGSNLAVLIDIVSYMYQCLMYQLNNAAAESMFSDTQIYENINRLIRMIGYHPRGYTPAQIRMKLNRIDAPNSIYPCTMFDTGLDDSRGQRIYFSTDFYQSQSNLNQNEDIDLYTTLYNGSWKKYPEVLQANGIENEIFTLASIKSDTEAEQYVASEFIRIIVTDKDDNPYNKEWICDNHEIFMQSREAVIKNNAKYSKLYTGQECVYTVYLNEDKEFELKFGDGITGRILNKGDKIHVFYLDTNGTDGNIDIGDIDYSNLKITRGISELNWENELDSKLLTILYFGPNSSDSNAQSTFESHSITENKAITDWSSYITLYGILKAKKEENVQDIQNDAPSNFKCGNRLITKPDYEYFFKTYQSGIVDVKCMNNWDYMTTFYRWLYNMGQNPNKYSGRDSNGYEFLEKYRLVNNGFQYVDSADANNVYLWIKMTDETDNLANIKQAMIDNAQLIKTMTQEIYPLIPIDVYFDISFTPDEVFYKGLQSTEDSSFDLKYSYLEVTMSDNSVFSNTVIKNNIVDIIKTYFDTENCKIGQIVDNSVILNKIYQINGVERVRTVFNPDQDVIDTELSSYDVCSRCCDGISFASWTNFTELVPIGEDIAVNNTNRTLEQFQFPCLSQAAQNNLFNKIKVIKKTMNTTNPIKF